MDTMKYLPSSFTEQISLSILSSDVHQNILNNKKHWIGRCPGAPPRQINISDPPYSLQKKVVYQELSRACPASTETSALIKSSQQQQRNCNKESLKITTVSLNSNLSNVNETNSPLSDALSKHFTIKAEPLRPTSNFLNNSTSTLSSWQKYWTSTETRKGRKEPNDSALPFSRPKRDQPNLTTTHFVTIRDSSAHANTNNNTPSQTPLIAENNQIPTKRLSSVVSEETQSLLPPLESSYERISLMNSFKSIDGKSLSTIESESTIVNDEINRLSTQIYKLPLPSTLIKTKKSVLKRRSRSKSFERKVAISSRLIERKQIISSSNTSVAKRKQPISASKTHRSTTKKQQQSLATVIQTTPRSKYEQINWDEPYIGVRFDPPTPPSSPTSFPWSRDNDHDENEIPYQLNYIDEVHL